MKSWPLFFLFFWVTLAQAATNQPLIISQVFKDGKQFVFQRVGQEIPRHGITIKDPHTKVILYEAKVVKCGPSKCLGQVVRNHSGLTIRTDEEYTHSYNVEPIKLKTDPNVLQKPAVVEPLPPAQPPPPPPPVTEVKGKEKEKGPGKPKKKIPQISQLYLGYGSPLGPGLSLGYFRSLNPQASWGLTYSNVSSTASLVGLKANVLSGQYLYNLLNLGDVVFLNLLGQLGFMQATLDYSNVSDDADSIDESTYLVAAAGEATLATSETWKFAIRMGLSKNGSQAEYTEGIATYVNPFNKLLAFLEIGVYYRFK